MGSVVISIRVPKKLKEELDRLGINYSKAVREFLEELVRREKARRLREKMEELKRSIGRIDEDFASRFVREDRNAR